MRGVERVGAVIAAAGASQRMTGVDKILADLDGAPVLSHVIDVFDRCGVIDQVVVVLSAHNVRAGTELLAEHGWTKVTDICEGGLRRQDSVTNGLARLRNCT